MGDTGESWEIINIFGSSMFSLHYGMDSKFKTAFSLRLDTWMKKTFFCAGGVSQSTTATWILHFYSKLNLLLSISNLYLPQNCTICPLELKQDSSCSNLLDRSCKLNFTLTLPPSLCLNRKHKQRGFFMYLTSIHQQSASGASINVTQRRNARLQIILRTCANSPACHSFTCS